MGGVSGKKKKKNCHNKKKNGGGSAEEDKEENFDNGGIVVEALMEDSGTKEKSNFSKNNTKIEENGEDTEAEIEIETEVETEREMEMQLKNIEWIFDDAELNSKIPVKFNRNWRFVVSDECLGLSRSILLTAFHHRYGGNEGSSAAFVQGVKNRGGEASTSVEHVNTCAEDGGGDSNIFPLDPHSIGEILARLPLPSMIRAKSVCKSWDAAIGGLMNVERHHLTAHHIAQGFHGIVFFSSPLNRWFRIPLPWKRWKWRLNYSRDQCTPGLGLSAAGGGLFLFVDWSSGRHYTPVVFNPLIKQHRVLPDFPLCPGMAIELIAESDHFKVITIASKDTELSKVTPLVYNSSTNNWTIGVPVATTCISHSHPWTSTVRDGVVYCTSSYGLHLGCYDIARDEFKFMEIEGGLPPLVDCLDYDKNFHAALPALVACNGKLILVARLQRWAGQQSILGRLPLIKHTLVGLWELDLSAKNKSWSLVSVTPQGLLEDTVKSSDGADFQ
ncbi:hypothetical protein KI387_030655, partial [Taxus chinensis]